VIGAWLLACAPKPVPTEPSAPPIPLTALPLNGIVDRGVYRDATLPFSVPVPAGWTAAPGAVPSPMRVRLSNADLGVRLEVWSYATPQAELPARPGCLWTFDDVGDYRVLGGSEELRVATCTPDDPSDPRLLATVVTKSGLTYHLEASIPETSFVAGKEAVRGLVDGIEWR
jgi:hypothetical protein